MESKNKMDVDHIVSLLMKEHTEISADNAGQLIREWITLISESLLREESVATPHFGTFECTMLSDNDPAHPATANGDVHQFRIGFTPSESLQKSVNSYFAHFEPTLLNEGVTFSELPVVTLGEEKKDDFSDNIVMRAITTPTIEPLQEEPVTEEDPIVEEASLSADPTEAFEPPAAAVPEPPRESAPNPLAESLQHMPDSSGHRPIERRRRDKTARRSSSIWIPIIGGVAIVIAGLFFLHRDDTEK